jgi:hypothetical protein
VIDSRGASEHVVLTLDQQVYLSPSAGDPLDASHRGTLEVADGSLELTLVLGGLAGNRVPVEVHVVADGERAYGTVNQGGYELAEMRGSQTVSMAWWSPCE